MRDVTGQLDRSIEVVMSSENEVEIARYRRFVGRLMGEILLEILQPIYAEHIDLTPNELRRD